MWKTDRENARQTGPASGKEKKTGVVGKKFNAIREQFSQVKSARVYKLKGMYVSRGGKKLAKDVSDIVRF